MNIHELIARIDPGIYEHLKTAVETGRWQNGAALSEHQRALCLQAVIAYDLEHKPEHERVGHIAMPVGACGREKPSVKETGSGSWDKNTTDVYRPVKLPDTDG